MMEIFYSVAAFIIAISLLVSLHEFGHFWVARRCGVKILTFSIGFGKPLWSRRIGRDQFALVISAVPLGGYVKMLDEREGGVTDSELHRAFNKKTLAQRFAIVSAGPIFNFIFAVIVFWLIFIIGFTGLKPVIGEVRPGSVADQAGLVENAEIIAVDSKATRTWGLVMDAVIGKVISGGNVELTVKDNSIANVLTLDLRDISIDDIAEQDLLDRLGIKPKRVELPSVIGDVYPGSPADEAGLATGDLILSADDQSINNWGQWVEYVQARPNREIMIKIEREEKHLILYITPDEKITGDGDVIGFIGASTRPLAQPEEMLARESYGILPALLKSIGKTADMSWLTLRMLGQIVTGQVSTRNLSGPIGIAQYAGRSVRSGFSSFLWFLAVISISLGVLNLLPILPLDGGHLLYYIIELFKGSPAPESLQLLSQQFGFLLLLYVMILTFYNDISGLIP